MQMDMALIEGFTCSESEFSEMKAKLYLHDKLSMTTGVLDQYLSAHTSNCS